MQRESYSTVSHFCDDALFRNWVITGGDDGGWGQWLKANPDKLNLAQEARHLILAIGIDGAGVTADETEQALMENLLQIREKEARVRSVWVTTWWRVAAAMLVFALGLTWYISQRNSDNMITSMPVQSGTRLVANDVEIYNDTKTAKLVNLEDGSTIILQSGGRLNYPKKFEAARRVVHLSGEAFFEISKNRQRPFLVYTSDIVTEVVGTSFRIKATDDQPEVEVFVKTGEVHVRQIKPENSKAAKKVILLPNQSVSFVKSLNIFEKPETKDIPKRAIEYLNFDFSDAPVKTIFSAIESAYGVTIDYPEGALRNCYLSTSLSDEPLLLKLKIVCESISSGTQFRMEGNHVIIESTGCN